jgi:hypothetical protein
MDIRERVSLTAAAIRHGGILSDRDLPIACRPLLRDVLPLIEECPELMAAARCFIESTSISEANGYTRRSLILTISATLARRKSLN